MANTLLFAYTNRRNASCSRCQSRRPRPAHPTPPRPDTHVAYESRSVSTEAVAPLA
ncbi:hypothetical protein K523DRAFT_323478 [Schizophyllum commune Tattone D]|nr:hypothetical protein K523DRAFT_323478 [Schizophyllum commune Tattone D]